MRPGFSPTGAKRQMGSITALAGHTHTTSIAVSIKGTPQRGKRTGGEMKKTGKMSAEEGREERKKERKSLNNSHQMMQRSSSPRIHVEPERFG